MRIMLASLAVLAVLAVLAGTSGAMNAHADVGSLMSPRAQMEAGIDAEYVACKEGKQLLIRDNGMALCINTDSVMRVVDAGLATKSDAPDSSERYMVMSDAIMATTNSLALYDEHGEAAFPMITAMNVTDGPYPWVMNIDTAEELADGSKLDRTGSTIWSDIELRAAMGAFRDELESGNPMWMSYVFLNPATDMNEAKTSWIVLRDGYVFGSGFYPDAEKAKSILPDWSIRKAIATYDLLGADEALAMITAMESTHENYPFVIDMDGIIVAHGSIPSHVGDEATISMLENWDEILEELVDTGYSTASYVFNNPATGNEEPKQSMLVLHDDYIFGSGIYDSMDMQ